MAEDIHKIWKLWGVGGLIDKIGPHRTIRELKKRGEAGAIIGWTLYKLLIEKWMDVAMTQVDPGARGPAYEFIEVAGEGELISKIEALHQQYPPKLSLIKDKETLVTGIPTNVRFDLKDEWNAALEKKVGRKIPMDPRDASKKDIEDSKKAVELLSAGEGLPRPEKPKFVPEKEEVQPKPAAQPRAAPEEVPPRPLIVKGTPELELMKKEIQDKINEEKRRRARGGGMAGEPEKPEYRHEILVIKFQAAIENAYSISELDRLMADILWAANNNRITNVEYHALIDKAHGRIRILRGELVDEPAGEYPAVSEYSEWTYDDFKVIINRITNIEELVNLAEHIDESKVMTPGDKVSAKQLVDKRKRLIESGAPEIKKQVQEQAIEGEKAQFEVMAGYRAEHIREDDKKKDDDVMQEPRDYTQWTFADFEGLIHGLEDVDDLEELFEYIDASDKVSQNEAETLRNMIKTRIAEIGRA